MDRIEFSWQIIVFYGFASSRILYDIRNVGTEQNLSFFVSKYYLRYKQSP